MVFKYFKWLLKWLLSLIYFLGKNGKVLDLIPYFLGVKIIFDSRTKSFSKFKLRNIEADFYTYEHCIIYNDISLDKIYQDKKLLTFYNKSVLNRDYPIIIDCGANIGLNTYHLSVLFPESIVIGIEPDPTNFKIATYNCRNLSNVRLLNAAISSKMQKLEITNKHSSPNSFITTPSKNGDVLAYTIFDVLKIYNLSLNNIFIIKVDIEGFEKDLFATNISWIDRTPLLIIEPHDWLIPWNSGISSFLKNKPEYFDLVIQGEYLTFYNHMLKDV